MNRPIPWTSSHLRSALRLLACSCVAAAALPGTARADDSEIYISQTDVAPNIMLILDTSGSMSGRVSTQDAYDPTVDYVAKATGNCAGIGNRVYFKTGDNQGRPPSCDSGAYVTSTNNKCSVSTDPLARAGSYQGDFFTQWRKRNSDSTSRSWRTLDSDFDTAIDCRKDPSPYPDVDASANTDTPQYTSTESYSYWKTKSGTSATLYSSNYVAYYEQFRNAVQSTRLQVMQQAAANLLRTVSNVNVGLMRYSANTYQGDSSDPRGNGGGIVLAPVAPIEQNRQQLIDAINAFVPDGNTPLSETLYEAYRYFTGGEVYFGNTSQACLVGTSSGCTGSRVSLKSVASSRIGNVITGTNYVSPATQDCQKNYIIYLTDGEPTSDNSADSLITGLPGFSDLEGGGCAASGAGRCLGALSAYMQQNDLRDGVMGTQNITTYYIGFGSDFGTSTSAFNFLVNAGTRGGGNAYQAGDLSELTEVFNSIFNSISQNSSTLTAPTVAVNAFNRTRTLNDLYISIFQPTGQIHWPGNIKKYEIDTGDDVTLKAAGTGDTRVDAIGPDGTFNNNGSDFWSSTAGDGARVERGGAAQAIPEPANRKVYTYIGNNEGSSSGFPLAGNAQRSVATGNTSITDAILGTTADSQPTRDKLIDWARGADIDDEDDDGSITDGRKQMGDPMHSQPAVLIYGGEPDAKDSDDAVVFTATNDGYVHAFSTTDGTELWAFIPQEMLPQLKSLYENGGFASKNYSLDGDIRLLKYDTNGDGVVDPDDDDKVLLFFSTGRNPNVSRYYALDVTRKNEPKFLWSIGEDKLEGLGQAWSRPTITRVNVDGASQNTQKLVLIFGGGYDTLEEGGPYIANVDVGNRVYMVDALKGTLLWSAGDQDATDADLKLTRMTHDIPSAINVVDLDGDGFADRMYVGDMAAQLWRFDIFNGKERSALVTGGVIASLGAKDATASAANTRRFYNAPDTALLQSTNSRPYINIAIGSGYRGHPLSTNNQDRFYAIRDYQPFAMLTQTQYDGLDITTEDELDDITTNLSPQLAGNSRGWLLQLNYPTYRGEKVLSSSTTLQNTIFFTSYTPSPNTRSNQCSPATGSNRAYAISAFDGSPLPPRASETDGDDDGDGDGDGGDNPTQEDRFNELEQTGIAPEVTTLFPDKDQVTCLSGVEVLNVCKDFNSRIKTYWRQTNAN
jgi:type IV pilus assembly protein PilY1